MPVPFSCGNDTAKSKTCPVTPSPPPPPPKPTGSKPTPPPQCPDYFRSATTSGRGAGARPATRLLPTSRRLRPRLRGDLQYQRAYQTRDVFTQWARCAPPTSTTLRRRSSTARTAGRRSTSCYPTGRSGVNIYRIGIMPFKTESCHSKRDL